MKRVYSGWSGLALVLVASAATACAREDGVSPSSEPLAGQTASRPTTALAPSSAPAKGAVDPGPVANGDGSAENDANEAAPAAASPTTLPSTPAGDPNTASSPAASAPVTNVAVTGPLSESALRAAVVLAASDCPLTATGTNAVTSLTLDVSALVNAKLAAEIDAAVSAGVDVDQLVQALASAVVAAARVHTSALVDAGVSVDLAATLPALLRVRAQVAASLTFTATLTTSLAGVPNAGAIVFAATQAAAELEANLAAEAVKSIVELAGASQALVDAAVAAGDQLIADVAAATTLAALKQARLDFVSAVLDGLNGTNASGGLLGALLTQTTGAVNTLLGSVLERVGGLASELDTTLNSKLSALPLGVCLDVNTAELDLTLQALIDSLAKFTADVQALGPRLVTGTTPKLTAAALTDLLAVTEVVLRGLP